jgi:Zn-dependent protease with chaperone function
MHITNNGNYVKDSSFKLVDASWVAMSNNEVSQLHANFVPLVVETKKELIESEQALNESTTNEFSKVETLKEIKIEKTIKPENKELIESKVEEVSNNINQEINLSDNFKNNTSALSNAYISNDSRFIVLSFLTIILFVGLIYFFIKYSKFDKLITARIVVISTLVFSGLSALSMIIDLTHVDPLIKMAVRSFFVSVFLASLYAVVSWIFAIRFMISELRELTSISTGYYETLYNDFKKDLARLGLDDKKIKIYVDENTEVVNAYAYTSFMGTSCVVINKPLIENLTADEVRAVVVHELGHIKHQDSAMMTIIMMTKDAIDRIVLAPVTLTRFAIRYIFSGIGIAFRSMNQAGVMALFIIFAISVFILGYAALMIVMFMLPGLLIDVFFNISAFKHSRDRELEDEHTVKEL